jgi:hypothetical protein
LKKVFLLLYRPYIYSLSLTLSIVLLAIRWKRPIIARNTQLLLKLRPSYFRLYFHLCRDLLLFVHGKYNGSLWASPKSSAVLSRMKNQGSLLLTAHFHNWELMGGWLNREGLRLLSAARILERSQAQRTLEILRSRIASPTVSESIPERSVAHIKMGGCFAVLWDQYSPQARFSSSFLGQPAAMNPLPIYLQIRTGAPIYFAAPLPGGEIRILQLSKGMRQDPLRLAGRYHRFLGILVRKYPTYWYGFCHRRFKDRLNYGGVNVSRETPLPVPEVSRETNH